MQTISMLSFFRPKGLPQVHVDPITPDAATRRFSTSNQPSETVETIPRYISPQQSSEFDTVLRLLRDLPLKQARVNQKLIRVTEELNKVIKSPPGIGLRDFTISMYEREQKEHTQKLLILREQEALLEGYQLSAVDDEVNELNFLRQLNSPEVKEDTYNKSNLPIFSCLLKKDIQYWVDLIERYPPTPDPHQGIIDLQTKVFTKLLLDAKDFVITFTFTPSFEALERKEKMGTLLPYEKEMLRRIRISRRSFEATGIRTEDEEVFSSSPYILPGVKYDSSPLWNFTHMYYTINYERIQHNSEQLVEFTRQQFEKYGAIELAGCGHSTTIFHDKKNNIYKYFDSNGAEYGLYLAEKNRAQELSNLTRTPEQEAEYQQLMKNVEYRTNYGTVECDIIQRIMSFLPIGAELEELQCRVQTTRGVCVLWSLLAITFAGDDIHQLEERVKRVAIRNNIPTISLDLVVIAIFEEFVSPERQEKDRTGRFTCVDSRTNLSGNQVNKHNLLGGRFTLKNKQKLRKTKRKMKKFSRNI